MGIGLFGKYPLKRDFIAFNLPRAVLDPIDNWLQAGIATSREARSTTWKEMFLVQPIWNFRLGRQLVGSDVLGAMMPSVDGVGRYFPLLLIAYAPAGKGFPIWTGLEIDDWLKSAHERLLSALADGELPTPEELTRGLDTPATTDIEDRAAGEIVPLAMGDDREALRGEVDRRSLDLAASMQSVWWTGGGAYVRKQVILCQGMPRPDAYTHMMGQMPAVHSGVGVQAGAGGDTLAMGGSQT